MPLDADKFEELKANIAFARKRPLAFGLCLGKAAETTVLLGHKTKDPETVGRLAKKEGETAKVVFGMMTVEGKSLNLACQSDVIPGLARKTREMLKAMGLKMKVCILDAEGNVLEQDADPEEDEAQAGAGAAAPDPDEAKWAAMRPQVEATLARAGDGVPVDMGPVRALWQEAEGHAEAGDFAAALKGATETLQALAAAVQAARTLEADRARWQAAAAKLGPIVKDLGAAGTAEAKKLTAYWAFAQSKAAGPAPDFAAVSKTLPLIVKLVGEIRARGQTAGAPPGGAGASAAAPSPKPAPAAAPEDRAGPVSRDENARLAALSDDRLLAANLTLRDTRGLFTDAYMQKLKTAPTKGAGNPDLKAIMRELGKGEVTGDRRTEIMAQLEAIVGIPPTRDRLDDDYGRFLVVHKQQQAKKAQKQAAVADPKKREEMEVPPVDEKRHPDFLASRGQLLFGKVLGDAFGIHEVFASLLSPTGGLVGPGNDLLAKKVDFKVGPFKGSFDLKIDALHLAADNPIAMHGTVHDAAGYLLNYHDVGPGYNYLGSRIEPLSTNDPLSGQISGIFTYWLPDAAIDKAKDTAAEIEKKLKPIRERAEAEIDKAIAAGRKIADDLAREGRKVVDATRKKATGLLDAIRGAPEKAEKAAVETLEGGKAKLGDMKEDAKRKLEAAWNMIWK